MPGVGGGNQGYGQRGGTEFNKKDGERIGVQRGRNREGSRGGRGGITAKDDVLTRLNSRMVVPGGKGGTKN